MLRAASSRFFAVLFTGKWPEGMRASGRSDPLDTRVHGYVLLLTDEYPPFSLQYDS